MIKFITLFLLTACTSAMAEDYNGQEQQGQEPEIVRTCEEQASSILETSEPKSINAEYFQSQDYSQAYQNCLNNNTLSAN